MHYRQYIYSVKHGEKTYLGMLGTHSLSINMWGLIICPTLIISGLSGDQDTHINTSICTDQCAQWWLWRWICTNAQLNSITSIRISSPHLHLLDPYLVVPITLYTFYYHDLNTVFLNIESPAPQIFSTTSFSWVFSIIGIERIDLSCNCLTNFLSISNLDCTPAKLGDWIPSRCRFIH